jgi:hypothetical protein
MAHKYGDATAMAGEFLVMEKLYRLGHQPALTVGRAKSIDILVKTKSGRLLQVSVKAVRGGGKWGVSTPTTKDLNTLVYTFVLFQDFETVNTEPDIYVVPALQVEELKEPWFDGHAVYYSPKAKLERLQGFRNAWHYIS